MVNERKALSYLTILGSTGSVGISTLDVVGRHPERFKVFALGAYRNAAKLAAQCMRFAPVLAVIDEREAAEDLQQQLVAAGSLTRVIYGRAGLIAAAEDARCDTVVAAIAGAAGLEPLWAAARAGKRIMLANKEALVMSGALFMEMVREHGATLLPVDSEHNGLYQCLPAGGLNQREIVKLTLTASGGPFLARELASLSDVTPDEACAHPNWVMGRKISVDSATMMNKGLEVIEAHWLFGVAARQIDVLIHPQSVVHALVTYLDGSVLAQLGNPDMRIPIAHALAYPERIASGVVPLDLAALATLTFSRPDQKRFPCLGLALAVLERGGTAGAILNAANEIAVQAFLNRRIGFMAIAELVDAVLQRVPVCAMRTLDSVLEADRLARHAALQAVNGAL